MPLTKGHSSPLSPTPPLSPRGGGGEGSTDQLNILLSSETTTTMEGGFGGEPLSTAELLLGRLTALGCSHPRGLLLKYGYDRVKSELDDLEAELDNLDVVVRNPPGLLVWRLKQEDRRAYGKVIPRRQKDGRERWETQADVERRVKEWERVTGRESARTKSLRRAGLLDTLAPPAGE